MFGSMGTSRKSGGLRPFLRAPVIGAALVMASAIVAPSVVRAFSTGSESVAVRLAARGGLGSFTPASIDPRLVAQASVRALAHGKLFRFTPAGMDNRSDRAITVAVRLPDARGRLIATRLAQGDGGAGLAAVRITPVAYNLGMARGYQSFALAAPSQARDLPRYNADLRAFSLRPAGADSVAPAARLAPRVAFDERANPGRAPRTLGTQGDYQIDMGGSYRLTGNLHVTAGLRYSSDRDRLSALTDHRQDNQAIYVGTQFRF